MISVSDWWGRTGGVAQDRILFLHFSASFTSTCGELLFIQRVPTRPAWNRVSNSWVFLTYLGDRLVWLATWDDAITERYLNVKVYVSTTGTPTWHHVNSPGAVRWSRLSRFNEQKSFTTSISLASTSCPFLLVARRKAKGWNQSQQSSLKSVSKPALLIGCSKISSETFPLTCALLHTEDNMVCMATGAEDGGGVGEDWISFKLHPGSLVEIT